MSSQHRRMSALIFSGVVAGIGGAIVVAAPIATATPVECRAPGASTAGNVTDTSECSATSTNGSAAAAFGVDGSATSAAGPQALALAIAMSGGTAMSQAQNLSGPAAIAIGPGATVDLTGVRPGLTLGIATNGATVTVDGVGTPTCTGGPAFAGDFQTLQGCVSLR